MIPRPTGETPVAETLPENSPADVPKPPEIEQSSEDELEESGRPLRLRRTPAWFGDYVSR